MSAVSDRYCPFTPQKCRTDCALFQHESCAIANAAGSLYGIMQLLNRLTTTEQAEEVGDDDPPA